MLNIDITPKAQKDLKNILNHTRRKWGKSQQTIYRDLVQKALHCIATNPWLGKPRTEISPDYYSYHVGSRGRHYIFYKIFADRIEIIRFIYDAMDIEQVFKAKSDDA
jgi:toxin ParE1/3/4